MIKLQWVDDNGNEREHRFPTRNVICGTCKGDGYLSHQDDLGTYKSHCACCRGDRVLRVTNESIFSEEDHNEYAGYQSAAVRDLNLASPIHINA